MTDTPRSRAAQVTTLGKPWEVALSECRKVSEELERELEKMTKRAEAAEKALEVTRRRIRGRPPEEVADAWGAYDTARGYGGDNPWANPDDFKPNLTTAKS